MKKLGIALSGGGARGIGHLGMLKALEEADIKPDIMAGTSAGSIVATLYSSGHSPEEILEFVNNTKVLKALKPALSFTGLLKVDTLGDIMKKYLPSLNFEDLEIPVIIAATDIVTGRSVYYEKGDIIKPIMASCCVPVFFSPVRIDDKVLVDGGVLDNLPVFVLKERSDFVLGLHTNPIVDNFEAKNIKSVIERSLIMAINGNTTKSKELCDFVIEPPELGEFGGFDLNKAKEMYEVGYNYAKSKTDELREMIDSTTDE